jgi:hypothetical protein
MGEKAYPTRYTGCNFLFACIETETAKKANKRRNAYFKVLIIQIILFSAQI